MTERFEVPEVDLEIETIQIPGPSRYLGWWCSCGKIHMGDLKYARRCVRCGEKRNRPDRSNRADEPDTIA